MRLEPTVSEPAGIYHVPCRSRGTLVRIDTRDGAIIGEYRCFPEGANAGFYGPAQTAIDREGAVWVLDRNVRVEAPASIVKIGLAIGGTRVSKSPGGVPVPDPNGAYLMPPFDHVSSGVVDRDGDGLIKTSRGLGDLLAWPDNGDGVGGPLPAAGLVRDADDELILVFQRSLPDHEFAGVATDPNGDVYWLATGSRSGYAIVKLAGDDGRLLASYGDRGEGGYSALLDPNGALWSGGGYTRGFLRFDTTTNQSLASAPVFNGRAMAWANDPHGAVWAADVSGTLWKLNPASGAVMGQISSGGTYDRGLAISPVDGDLWTALHDQNRVARFNLAEGRSRASIAVGVQPTNLGFDPNGFVWVSSRVGDSAMRIDPNTNAIDRTVDLGGGAGPYNYHNGMGVTPVERRRYGTWTVVHDGCAPGSNWTRVAWTAESPAQTSLSVFARAADDAAQLAQRPWSELGPTRGGQALVGRYLEIQARFAREKGAPADVSPLLHEVVAEAAPLPCLAIDIWPNRFPNPIILSLDNTVLVGVMNRTGDPDGAGYIDPTTIDWNDPDLVARFGPLDNPAAAPSSTGTPVDLDGDGDTDVLLGFRSIDCGFALGDEVGALRIERACQPLLGADSVVVCQEGPCP